MTIFYIIIIFLLSVALVTLIFIFRDSQKKSIHIPDEDREFMEFTIDMYIQYANELNINSPEQHGKIVKKLEKIKSKYFKNEQN